MKKKDSIDTSLLNFGAYLFLRKCFEKEQQTQSLNRLHGDKKIQAPKQFIMLGRVSIGNTSILFSSNQMSDNFHSNIYAGNLFAHESTRIFSEYKAF